MGTIYRDDDYGVLGVALTERGLEVVDYGFRDGDAVFAILGAQAELVCEDGAALVWRPKVHQRIVEANIDRDLRGRGYTDDVLGAKAILQVEDIRDCDIPEQGYVHVSEAVERVMGAHLNGAVGKLGVSVATATFEAYPRPYATPGADGRKPPFFVARAMAPGLVETDVVKLEQAWRDALAHLGPGLVRATAQRANEDVVVFEAGYSLPLQVMEAFESAELPAFDKSPIQGAREVHIHMGEALADADVARIRERAMACTAAAGLSVMEGEPRVLRAHIPSTHEGDHLADDTFRDRVTWLTRELAEWGPSLEWVGRMEEPTQQIAERADPLHSETIQQAVERGLSKYGVKLKRSSNGGYNLTYHMPWDAEQEQRPGGAGYYPNPHKVYRGGFDDLRRRIEAARDLLMGLGFKVASQKSETIDGGRFTSYKLRGPNSERHPLAPVRLWYADVGAYDDDEPTIYLHINGGA